MTHDSRLQTRWPPRKRRPAGGATAVLADAAGPAIPPRPGPRATRATRAVLPLQRRAEPAIGQEGTVHSNPQEATRCASSDCPPSPCSRCSCSCSSSPRPRLPSPHRAAHLHGPRRRRERPARRRRDGLLPRPASRSTWATPSTGSRTATRSTPSRSSAAARCPDFIVPAASLGLPPDAQPARLQPAGRATGRRPVTLGDTTTFVNSGLMGRETGPVPLLRSHLHRRGHLPLRLRGARQDDVRHGHGRRRPARTSHPRARRARSAAPRSLARWRRRRPCSARPSGTISRPPGTPTAR